VKFSDIQNKATVLRVIFPIWFIADYCSWLSFVRETTNVGVLSTLYFTHEIRVGSFVPPKKKYSVFHKNNTSSRIAIPLYLISLIYQRKCLLLICKPFSFRDATRHMSKSVLTGGSYRNDERGDTSKCGLTAGGVEQPGRKARKEGV